MSQDLIEVPIKGEILRVGFKNGKVFSPDYDLENEEMALLLTGGYGEGGGVLLLALNEVCTSKAHLKELVENFELTEVYSRTPNFFGSKVTHVAKICHSYFSYSPVALARHVASEGLLSQKSVLRLIKDNDELVALAAARREDAPLAGIAYAIKHFELSRRILLAKERPLKYKEVPLWLQDIPEVRIALAGNIDLPEKFIRIMANDEAEEVVLKIAERDDLPIGVFEVLAHSESEFTRLTLALHCKKKSHFAILLKDPSEKVRKLLASNPHLSVRGMEVLAKDPSNAVRDVLQNNKRLPRRAKAILKFKQREIAEIGH